MAVLRAAHLRDERAVNRHCDVCRVRSSVDRRAGHETVSAERVQHATLELSAARWSIEGIRSHVAKMREMGIAVTDWKATMISDDVLRVEIEWEGGHDLVAAMTRQEASDGE